MCDRTRHGQGSGLFGKKGRERLWGGLFLFAALLCAASASAMDILDRPLDVTFRAAPTVVMFVLDDSGSMDWEFMTPESSGLFQGNRYVFPKNSGDSWLFSGDMNTAERSMWKSQWFGYNKLYYNPASDYTPWPSNTGPGNLPNADTANPRSDPMSSSKTLSLNDTYLAVLKHGTETDAYDPVLKGGCKKWVSAGTFHLDHTKAYRVIVEQKYGYHVSACEVLFREVTGTLNEITLNGGDSPPEYSQVKDWWRLESTYIPDLKGTGDYEISFYRPCSNYSKHDVKITVVKDMPLTEIKNSHYYLLDDSNGNGTADSGEGVYLVNMDGGTRSYYRVDHDGDGQVEDGELEKIEVGEIPASIRPHVGTSIALSDAADLQNFANWYSFYRGRSLAAKAAVARTIVGVEGLKVGFYSINGEKQEAVEVKILQPDGTVLDKTHDLLTRLYDDIGASGGTPLRRGLAMVGEYFMNKDGNSIGPSPYETAENGGACQRVYAIAMTDGYWNDWGTYAGDPDEDGVANTLADVAMKYYKEDQRDDLENFVPPTKCNSISLYKPHQHMVTFAVSFGVHGSLNPEDYDPCTLKNAAGEKPKWPDPHNKSIEKIDDLWHAAANTGGEFFSASDPQSLVDSLTDIFIEIDARELSASSVAVSSEKLYTESTMYEGSYLSINWTGDIKAYGLSSGGAGGVTIDQEPLWSAAAELDKSSVTWDKRRVITSDGTTGKPFRWSGLTETQKAHLNNNEYMLKYLRGFRLSDATDPADKAGLQPFRVRDSRLGDIVNSSPVKIGNSLYVGANDGMLHVFNADNGEERFAYVPNLVFGNLGALTSTGYQHRFYVDLTPVYYQPGLDESIGVHLVGGLGKGGKGYYCLDVGGVDTMAMTETGLAALVKWEFSDSGDLGYTFSSPVIIRTKSQESPYVVVFGNGYDSAGGRAVLFVVDLLTGALVKKIDTQVGDDNDPNGLSSPAVTDVNNDRRIDYVYCGDLKGNLWKFDLSSANPDEWEVAFQDSAGNPLPLFTTAAGQPITSRPQVMYHCTDMGYLVAFGTGKYLGLSDLADKNTQAIYGIWDYGDDDDNGECLGTFKALDFGLSRHPDEVRLLKQEVVSTTTDQDGKITRVTTENPAEWHSVPDKDDPNENQTRDEGQKPNPTSHIGWFLNLESPGERVYQDVIIRSGVLIVLSMIPVDDPCSGGGYTMVYALNPCNGAQRVPAWADNRKLEEPTIIEIHGPEPPDDQDPSDRNVDEGMIFSHGEDVRRLDGTAIVRGKYFWRTMD